MDEHAINPPEGGGAHDPHEAHGGIDPGAPPPTPEALHAWLIASLGIHVPRSALVEGHAAPFDYLCWSFFEGRGGLGGAPAADAPADAVLWANRGGGKTFLGALATALDLVFKPGIQVRLLAGSLEQGSRMHEHLRTLFEHPLMAPLVSGRITDRRVRLVSGSRAALLAQSQASVRGSRVQKIRCDEVELFDPGVWEAAQLATRSGRFGRFEVRGSVECVSTMHLAHGLMARLVEEARAGRRRLFRWGVVDVLEACPAERRCHAPGSDAPSEPPEPGALVRLPVLGARPGDCILWPECEGRAKNGGRDPGFLPVADAIDMKRRVGEAQWASEMLCHRPRRSDAVLPEFDRAVHTFERPPWELAPGLHPFDDLLWLAGVDFGYRAPTVIIWAAADALGRLWIMDERSVSGCLMHEHVEALVESPLPRPAWIGADHAGNQVNDHTGTSNSQLLRSAGFIVRSRSMPIAPGISLIRARLRPAAGDSGPRLFVHVRCAHLLRALEEYHYDPSRPDSTTPVKDGHDHAIDALRYLVANFDRPNNTRLENYN